MSEGRVVWQYGKCLWLSNSILESPDVEFAVKSLVGYSTKIKDLPKLEEVIVSRLKKWLGSKVIHPNYFYWELPTFWADACEDPE